MPSLPAAGGPAESEIVLDLNNNSQTLDPNKSIEHTYTLPTRRLLSARIPLALTTFWD